MNSDVALESGEPHGVAVFNLYSHNHVQSFREKALKGCNPRFFLFRLGAFAYFLRASVLLCCCADGGGLVNCVTGGLWRL